MKRFWVLILVFAYSNNTFGSGIGNAFSCGGFGPLEFLINDLTQAAACNQFIDSSPLTSIKPYCDCLNNLQNKNIIVRSEVVANEKFEGLHRKSTQDEYLGTILNVYEQINIGVAIQEQMYGISSKKPNETVIGCKEEEFANNIKSELTEALGEQISDSVIIEDGLDSCIKDKNSQQCNEASIRINNFCSDPKKRQTVICAGETACGIASSISQNAPIFQVAQMQPGTFSHDQSGTVYETDPVPDETEIGKFFDKFPSLKPKDNILDRIEDYKCKKYFFSKQNEIDESVKTITTALKKRNKDVVEHGLQNYENLSPNACLGYQDYQVIRSIPDKSLLDEFSSMSESDLSPKGSPALVQFLSHNPVLAKLSAKENNRPLLISELKKLKKKLGNNPTDIQRIEAFTNFMKNDVANLIKDKQFEEINQCFELAGSLASIFQEKALPPISLKPDDLRNNILACKVEDYNKRNLYEPQLKNKLESNPLFLTMGNAPQVWRSPDDDLGYQDYIKKNCKGWEEFYNQRVTETCTKLWKMPFGESCREKFQKLKKGRTQELLDEYYRIHNPKLGQIIATIRGNTSEVTGDGMRRRLEDRNQDNKAKNYFYQVLLPKKKEYEKKYGSSFNYDKFLDEELQNYNNSISPVRAPASDYSDNSVINNHNNSSNDKQQVQPSWAQGPAPANNYESLPLKPTNALDHRSATDFLDPSPDLSFKERAEDRQELMNKIESLEKQIKEGKIDDSIDEKALQKRLNEYKKQLKEEEEKDKKEMKQRNAPATATPEVPRVAPPVSAGSGGRPDMSPYGASNNVARKESSKTKYNKAILAMYDDNGNKIGGNLVVENIPVSESVIDPNAKPLQLTPNEQDFRKILSDQNFAAQFIFTQVKPMRESVVALVDPQDESRVMLVKITKKGSDFVVNPVARVHSLNKLKRLLPEQN